MRLPISKRFLVPFALFALGLVVSLGCGGDSNGGNGNGPLVATFTPSSSPPSGNSLTMQAGSSSGDTFTVLIQATDMNDVFGATFDVTYDPDVMDVVSWTADGSLLEVAGSVVFLAYPTSPGTADGQIEFVISRQAPASPVDVSGTETLMSLTFEAKQAVSSTPITFASSPRLVCSGEIDAVSRTCTSIAPVPQFAGGNLTVTN